jgi:hypothetical protein
MRTPSEKLRYISETTGELRRLSDELNLRTLSYLLRMAELEAETVELAAPPTSGDRGPPGRRSN